MMFMGSYSRDGCDPGQALQHPFATKQENQLLTKVTSSSYGVPLAPLAQRRLCLGLLLFLHVSAPKADRTGCVTLGLRSGHEYRRSAYRAKAQPGTRHCPTQVFMKRAYSTTFFRQT